MDYSKKEINMQRKFRERVLIFLSISMASMLFGCDSNNGTKDNSKSDDFRNFEVTFYKEQLADDFYNNGDWFFVNDEVFKENFFELQKDNKPELSENLSSKLEYKIKKADSYRIVFPENGLIGEWTIEDGVEATEIVYSIPGDVRDEFKTGPMGKSTINHQFYIENPKDIKSIRFKLLDRRDVDADDSFEEAEAKVEVVFEVE